MSRTTIATIAGLVLTPFALVLALVSSGAGHGDYLAARLLFPASMLTTHLFARITAAALLLACVQFPIYGWLIGVGLDNRSRMICLLPGALHVVLVALILIFPDPSFS